MTSRQAYQRYKSLKTQLTRYVIRSNDAANGQQFYSDFYCQLSSKVSNAWDSYIQLCRLGQ